MEKDKMKKYINVKFDGVVETVDQFDYNTKEERKECKRCLKEYNISDSSNYYYLSSRAAKEWRESK